jgi:translation elongation factor EF-4
MMSLLSDRRGQELITRLVDEKKYYLKYLIPMSEVITDLFDKIKSMTQGYGSLDFEFKKYQKADIRKMVILLMHDPVDALSFMVHESRAFDFGKLVCKRLKEKIPMQQFPVVIQAKLGGKIIAREEVPMMKKNVTAKCYGGDYSRKRKLLDRQKEGKKFLRKVGKVEVSKETFMGILKT